MPDDLTAGLGFAPDAGRAALVDRAVRARLAASLEKVFGACAGFIRWQPEALANLLDSIGQGPVRAAVMALYSDLTEAVFRDDFVAAQNLADELLSLPPAVPAGRGFTIDDATLGAGQAARFMRMITDDGATRLSFHPWSSAALRRHAAVLHDALALLRHAAPALAGEIGILLREIVLADLRRPPTPETELGGSSVFYLWGAAFIGFNQAPSRLELAEAIAHEAAHLLLFGLTLGRPLVRNDRDAAYASPLRDDPRPMDGVVHAAFVVARLTWTMERLLASVCLTAAETATARSWLARNRRDFAASCAVIETDAVFTAEGAAIFAGAAAFMRDLAGADQDAGCEYQGAA